MVRIAVYGKGGIGKSTMSSNLTAALSDNGHKVLQIGCDPKHDSTRLLLGGEVKSTILDYMKDTPPGERRLDDVVSEGYKGCLCAEAGGPEPGVGCAGRGIISSFDLLRDLGGDSILRDVTLYDVLGDVVCGGFAVPLRNEYAEIIYIVSSGEFMSIYAANNILKGICNYDPDRVGGIIFNSRGDPEEENR
ncbi:MAG: AAA family ATPase, partial [Candidatus Methanomethylophilaceae archaeon]|nr:AAA family ATPase [Candidatus Methanomethylophilaceae archaeon]